MVQADKTANFSVPLTLRLGLSDVGMQTLALRDGKDVIVQQTIQNYGERPIDYGSFAIFPGQARQERLVTNLAPGRTTLKRYRFSDVTVTPGMKIRVGVKELEGSRILNDEVEIQ
jgi:urease beta subunit